MCVVVTAGVMLTPTKTEAQNPTWELYGMDKHIKYEKRYYGLFNLFWYWRKASQEIIKVDEPGGDREGYATKTVWHYDLDSEYVGYAHLEHAKTEHWNNREPSFTNVSDYIIWVGGEKTDHPPKKYPAVGMEGKAHVVGTITEHVSGASNKEVYRHTTYLKVTAQHKTGGTKNFTVTVTYQVAGRYGRTKISKQISLAPDESTTMRLSAPGGRRNWATIISIDVRENRPLEVPQPPRIQQGTPPGLPPTPPLPGPRRPRTQSEESPE